MNKNPPNNTTITPRPIKFAYQSPIPHYWYQNNIAITITTTILAAYIPYCEKFFIKNVKALRYKITNPKLLSNISHFVRQESFHSREHLQFYHKIIRPRYPALLKYPIELIIPALIFALSSKKFRLSVTAAGEHFTAVSSNIFLSTPGMMDNIHQDIKAMWQWHCIEEIEHKAVVFDMLKELNIGYFSRTCGFLVVNFISLICFWRPLIYMLIKDKKLFSARFYKQMFQFCFTKPGIISKIIPPLFAYLRPSFHPWQKNDYPLIEKTVIELNKLSDSKAQHVYLRGDISEKNDHVEQ
tara:strand:+ start:82151 stop:83041 length:891 start_codon:yes stop_codon:yes gene_type:complete